MHANSRSTTPLGVSLFRKAVRSSISAIDSTLIYEGIFSPENNLIVIIQNFYVWAVSSLGLLALIPFYQVRHFKSN